MTRYAGPLAAAAVVLLGVVGTAVVPPLVRALQAADGDAAVEIKVRVDERSTTEAAHDHAEATTEAVRDAVAEPAVDVRPAPEAAATTPGAAPAGETRIGMIRLRRLTPRQFLPLVFLLDPRPTPSNGAPAFPEKPETAAHAAASLAVTMPDTNMSVPMPTEMRRRVRVATDDKTRSVLLRGDQAMVDEIGRIAEAFDQDEPAPARLHGKWAVPLRRGDVHSVWSALRKLELPVVSVVPAGDGCVVVLRDDDVAVIDQAMEVIEALEPSDRE